MQAATCHCQYARVWNKRKMSRSTQSGVLNLKWSQWEEWERKAKLPSVKIVHSVLMKITGSYLILYSFQLKLADTKSQNMKAFMYIVFTTSWYSCMSEYWYILL